MNSIIPNIRISDYPQLAMICWNRNQEGFVLEDEALALYERNWIWIDKNDLNESEKNLINKLVKAYGNGVLLV